MKREWFVSVLLVAFLPKISPMYFLLLKFGLFGKTFVQTPALTHYYKFHHGITSFALFSSNPITDCETFNNSLGKVITAHVSSIRFDKVIRKGLNMSQMEFEKSFYNQSFRVNENFINNKSKKLKQCDVLDLVIREEDGKIFGKRVVLSGIQEKSNGYIITLRCFRRTHQLNDV